MKVNFCFTSYLYIAALDFSFAVPRWWQWWVVSDSCLADTPGRFPFPWQEYLAGESERKEYCIYCNFMHRSNIYCLNSIFGVFARFVVLELLFAACTVNSWGWNGVPQATRSKLLLFIVIRLLNDCSLTG